MKDNMSLKWQEMIVSFFYLGRSPIAPGTMGTLGAVFVLIYLKSLNTIFNPIDNMGQLTIMIVLCYLVGLKLASWAEEEYYEEDPSIFVLDEVVGYWVAVLVCGIGGGLGTYYGIHLLMLFFLFRFFDISKIGLIGRMEKIEGGHGILLDDVVAGIYAGLAMLIMYNGIVPFELALLGFIALSFVVGVQKYLTRV